MLVWRICKSEHVKDAFSGIGAERYGGRWNHKGDKMVYTSTSLSLASLELFVHLQPSDLPDDLVSIVATLSDSVSSQKLEIAELPANWRNYPAPASLQDLGSQWLCQNNSLLLIVPSAVNPEERNVLLNPIHREFTELTDIETKPFHFDPRMWK